MTEKRKELVRAVKFTLFSASAGLIQALSFLLMNAVLLWRYWVSNLIALVLSVVWNFTLNRKFTFRSANNVPVAMMKVAVYYAIFTPLSTIGGAALVNRGWNDFLVFAISMLLNFVTEFLYDRFFVFGASIDTAVNEKDTEIQ